MKKIVYLPLDERPCNSAYTAAVSEGHEAYRLMSPALEELGVKKTPADYSKIEAFLLRECSDADCLIIALDTLLYGGIIPSRLHGLKREELVGRLDILKRIKEDNPNLHISAFSLVMRCPCYSDSSEEPDYYAVCGKEIFAYGQNEHKLRLGEISREKYEAKKAELSVCLPYIEDYETRRAVNIECLTDALKMVGKCVDEFTILQDDSNARGYTAMDREKVLAIVEEYGIDLDTYPGADEAGLTLLARAATRLENRRPKIYAKYPRAGACDVVPIYEDREIKKTVSAQIKSAGAIECDSEDEADLVLYCNLNDERTYDVYLNYTKQTDESYIDGFVEGIAKTLESGRGAAVADVAYCNSGDITFATKMERRFGVLKLWGYAGWNTASNTLGTVICQGVLRYLYGDSATHRRFTAHRIMDDTVYSADVRLEMRALGYGADGALIPQRGEASERIVRRINERTKDLFPSVSEKYEATDCYMPWQRLFEIGLKIKEK